MCAHVCIIFLVRDLSSDAISRKENLKMCTCGWRGEYLRVHARERACVLERERASERPVVWTLTPRLACEDGLLAF
jgi:hypothetical protein